MLHLLANHPDFNTSLEDIVDIAKYVDKNHSSTSLTFLRYIQFYLDLVATQETVSLLYHLALKGKTVRVAESHAVSEVITFS